MRMAALSTHMCIIRKCARGVFLCDLEKRIACVSSVGVVLLMVKSTVKLHFVIKKKGSLYYTPSPSLVLLLPLYVIGKCPTKSLGFLLPPSHLLYTYFTLSVYYFYHVICYSVLQHVLSLQVRHKSCS